MTDAEYEVALQAALTTHNDPFWNTFTINSGVDNREHCPLCELAGTRNSYAYQMHHRRPENTSLVEALRWKYGQEWRVMADDIIVRTMSLKMGAVQ